MCIENENGKEIAVYAPGVIGRLRMATMKAVQEAVNKVTEKVVSGKWFEVHEGAQAVFDNAGHADGDADNPDHPDCMSVGVVINAFDLVPHSWHLEVACPHCNAINQIDADDVFEVKVSDTVNGAALVGLRGVNPCTETTCNKLFAWSVIEGEVMVAPREAETCDV